MQKLTRNSKCGFTVTRTFLLLFLVCRKRMYYLLDIEGLNKQFLTSSGINLCNWSHMLRYNAMKLSKALDYRKSIRSWRDLILTLHLVTSSSIFSTIAESKICRSHDERDNKLTGCALSQETISCTFSALQTRRTYCIYHSSKGKASITAVIQG